MSANAFAPQSLGLQGADLVRGSGCRRRPCPQRQQQAPGAQQPWGPQGPWQQGPAAMPWQQSGAQAQPGGLPNPWAQQQPAWQPAQDPSQAARRVAELEAMVQRLTQQLNAAMAAHAPQLPAVQNPYAQAPLQQPALNLYAPAPVVNPYAQASVPVAPAAQSPAWLNSLPAWLRPAGAQVAALPAAAPAAPAAPAANGALAAIAAAAAAAAGQAPAPVAPAPGAVLPAPAAVAPAAPAVAMAADGRPQPLVDAIATYRAEISRISQSSSSMEPMVFSGALHSGGPVYLLPGLMLPHGVQMLSWAYLGRAASAEELAKYQQWTTAAASQPNGAKEVFARIMKDIEDRGVFQKLQQKLAAGQPVGDLAAEAVAIRQAAAAMLTYAKA